MAVKERSKKTNMGGERRTLGNYISTKEIDDFKTDKGAYIRFLLRVGAFETMAEMAEDMGVTDGYIRQVKHRAIHGRSNSVSRTDYARRVLRLWNAG